MYIIQEENTENILVGFWLWSRSQEHNQIIRAARYQVASSPFIDNPQRARLCSCGYRPCANKARCAQPWCAATDAGSAERDRCASLPRYAKVLLTFLPICKSSHLANRLVLRYKAQLREALLLRCNKNR